MSPYLDDDFSDDLQDVARRLRDERVAPSAGELDELKLKAMARARARSSRTKGRATMKSRALVALITVGLMAGGTGGVIAASNGNGNGNGNAGNSQYKPGYGPCKNGGVDGSGATHTGPPGHPRVELHDGSAGRPASSVRRDEGAVQAAPSVQPRRAAAPGLTRRSTRRPTPADRAFPQVAHHQRPASVQRAFAAAGSGTVKLTSVVSPARRDVAPALVQHLDQSRGARACARVDVSPPGPSPGRRGRRPTGASRSLAIRARVEGARVRVPARVEPGVGRLEVHVGQSERRQRSCHSGAT